jgi:hypothetical protein
MDALTSGIGFLVLMVVAVVVISRFMGGPRMKCTRCQGSGTVDERWPDPSKPGGWHRLEGKCPKCKGKGKV